MRNNRKMMYLPILRLMLILSIILLPLISACQKKFDQKFSNDTVIKELQNFIPPGWVHYVSENNLIIQRDDSVWVVFENKINADAGRGQSVEAKEEFIKKNGKKTVCRFIYEISSIWTEAQIKNASLYNDSINNVIAGLEDKYGLGDLLSHPSKDQEYTMYAKMEETEEKLKLYNAEQKKLIEQKLILPSCETQFFSLFFKGAEAMEDGFTTVYPQSATAEMYKLQNQLSQWCAQK